MTGSPFALPAGIPHPAPTAPDAPGRPRVGVAAALERLHVLTGRDAGDRRSAGTMMDELVPVLVPALADRCAVELLPASSPTPPAERASGFLVLTFTSDIDTDVRGVVRCSWDGDHLPSDADVAVIRAIVDQCVLLADQSRLTERMDQLHVHTEQLRAAVESNRRIGAAIGVLMVRSSLTEEAAFDALRRASNTANRKLREVADEVIYTGALPERQSAHRAPAH
ncbi:ANTAR domain-containing protein [Nakamurella flavida]|uniref:ANTAR domain-containing protein n=1 Tax=Nakamurella flavida TaxID=363630 RepID=A0A938YRN3_9ACTN|nr:ANTAR domain-containing protein [Nakamurella flavida]MBM9477968.1 ANTAR domain-containing protein [Nakamurella flavida]MDP9778316.1 hypothetical protein [Nakamurella flavida]